MLTQSALLTAAEVAKLAGVKIETVRLWVRKGALKVAARTPGGKPRFRAQDVFRRPS